MFNNYEKGFTLIEAIIAISVGLIGAFAGYLLIANIQHSMAGSSAVVKAQQEGRIILERLTRELRESNPDKVWPSTLNYESSDYIVFLTPRDSSRKFIVDSNGKPKWQRAIIYWFNKDSKQLVRNQTYVYSGSGEPTYGSYQNETVSENVEKLVFSRIHDMINISIRTFSKDSKTTNMANSYADLTTKVKLRN